jgi:hypothetical protein
MARRLNWEKANRMRGLTGYGGECGDDCERVKFFERQFWAKELWRQHGLKSAKETPETRRMKDISQKIAKHQLKADCLKRELEMTVNPLRQPTRGKVENRFRSHQTQADIFRADLAALVARQGHCKNEEPSKAEQADAGDALRQGHCKDEKLSGSARRYLRAARLGDAKAQFILGHKYYKGNGVPQNYEEAYAWLNVAAERGYPKAGAVRDVIAKALTPSALLTAQQLFKKYR